MRLPDVHVVPTALVGYGSVVAGQCEALRPIKAALARIQVPAGAFGKLPGSAGLHASYTEHADAEQRNTGDLVDCLDAIAVGLHTTAANYTAAEAELAGLFGARQ
ncbi:hypothetical protein LN042_16630 [Kitasatospora sp. RB6PN24]|uniref:hypothetical protein n=1 Tax=Kitasatospora humi TaxID=2893891 RepID=UPI001E592B0D|nr:hypothetical protein [Kitasatospora humi]MCC9308688.1 hypothetical protein [Kitasatospora humi]